MKGGKRWTASRRRSACGWRRCSRRCGGCAATATRRQTALAPDEAGGSAAFPLDEAGGRALVWGLLGGGRLAARSLAGLLDQATAAFAAAPRVSDVFLENGGPMRRRRRPARLARRPLNRGNHEDTALSSAYDFEGELTRKYGRRAGAALLEQCGRLFAAMPVAARPHRRRRRQPRRPRGAPRGLPPVDALYAAPRATSVAAAHYGDGDAGELLVQDLLWSDPSSTLGRLPEDGRAERGAGRRRVTDLGGVERWTVFSASRYPHGTGLNKAAVLALSGDGAAAPSRWDHDRPERPRGRGRQRPAVGSTHVTPAALERDVGDDYGDVAVTRDALAARILAFLHRHRGALTLALGEASAELRRVLGDDARGFAAFARAVGEVNATLPADRAIDAAAVWALLALADG
ncbi:manganese ion binding protein [Aureococcus anophagefferens]|nr:manganese ion binding protein [Aureococcus anophagefferens]